MYNALCPILFRDKRDRDCWPATGLEQSIASVDADALAAEYRALRQNAPRRRDAGKEYFVGHDATTKELPLDTPKIQWEPRYAMAFWNLACLGPRPNGGWHRFLDYQLPLRARSADSEIRAVDLFGVTDRGRVIVVELKCPRSGLGQSPMHALMEGLRYAAVVEASLEVLASETRKCFGCKADAKTPPVVQVSGPLSWWRNWLKNRAAGNWRRPSQASAIEAQIDVVVECMATDMNIEEITDR